MKKYKIGDRIIHADSVVDAVKIMKQTMKDDASKYATIMALIEDEKAAVEAYNVAIRNLDGQIPGESLAVIKAIRDDENRHIENLMAVVNGNVTQKNLEDSMKDRRMTYVNGSARSVKDKAFDRRQLKPGMKIKWTYAGEKFEGTIKEVKQYGTYTNVQYIQPNGVGASFSFENEVITDSVKDSLRYTRKAQIYVYPRSSNDKQDILRLCSNLNTKCKILSETNEQMKLEIDGDVDSVVDDLKSLGLMRRGDEPRYIDA